MLVDDRGVPHLFGQTEHDVVWGLGFFHARDRLFQVLLLKHASQGRLTELFGEDLLGLDMSYRLLTYRLDEAVEQLDPVDRGLIEAYLDGLNRGAKHAGPSAEMRLLGASWEPLQVRDVLALVRLQAWGLSRDMKPELHKSRILSRLPEGDTRRVALLKDVPTGGVPIVLDDPMAHVVEMEGGDLDAGVSDGEMNDAGVTTLQLPLPTADGDGGTLVPLEALPSVDGGPAPSPASGPGAPSGREAQIDAIRARALAFLTSFGPTSDGASNSWVIGGEHTESGKPLLLNDPHLRHLLPSTFYLAHLETPSLRAVGATFPGIPAVVIGHTRHLAWGMTTSYVDTQDLVRLELDPGDDSRYLLGGKPQRFGLWSQAYKNGDGENLRTERWRTTVFGPVLEGAWSHLVEPGQEHALLWTGFDPGQSARALSGFFALYRATDEKQARAALERIGSPSQNVVLAFTDGTIAYHLMGAIPRRSSGAPIDRPRAGRSIDASWSGILGADEKPKLSNPTGGYLVAANQRVTDDSGPREIGRGAAPPHRAQRIHELLRRLVKRGKIKLDEALALQGDIESVEVRRLLPPLVSHCPKTVSGYDRATVQGLCAELKAFDGRYTTDTRGALVFNVLLEQLQAQILEAHLGEDVALQLKGDPATVMAIEEALLGEAAGEPSPLLDDRRTPEREGVAGFVRRAVIATLDALDDSVGLEPEDWRWGRHHILQPQNPLSRAPVIGGRFALGWRSVPGHNRTVRAEGGTPVQHGAVLRFAAELKDPIEGRFTLDFGQSGHMGHPHIDDQRDDWQNVRPRPIPVDKAAIPVASHVRLMPGPVAADAGTGP